MSKKSKVGVVFGTKVGSNLVQYCEKRKKLVFQWGVFDILHDVYICKHEVVVVEMPEWKRINKNWKTPYQKEIRMKFLPILDQKEQKVTILEVFS